VRIGVRVPCCLYRPRMNEMNEDQVQKTQCSSCPWKKSTNPRRDIQDGYSEDGYRALVSTIADPGSVNAISAREAHVFACHKSAPGSELAAARAALRRARLAAVEVE